MINFSCAYTKRLNSYMKINEITNAESVLALWKLVSDNMWQAISTQAEQEMLEKAKKAAAAKAKPAKRGGGRKSAAKSAISVATPSPSTVKPAPAKTSDAQAADAASTQSSKQAQQVQALQAQGPLPRMASVQAIKPVSTQPASSAQLPPSVALPNTLDTAVRPAQKSLPKLSARHGGVVADDTAK
jgi:hypothetical protein